MTKNALRRVIEEVLEDYRFLDEDDVADAADSIVEICDERGLFGNSNDDDDFEILD